MKQGKIIGVLNQKGGVGKSILTTNLAINLFLRENKSRDKNFVAIYDGDIPQYTIKNIRAIERDMLKQRLDTSENDYYMNKYKKIYYDGFEPFKIYSGSIDDVYDKFEVLRENHDFTFIDIVGTVNVSGYDETFLSNFDLIIVPTNLDYEVLRSSLNFVKYILHPLQQNKKIEYAILLNNIDGREKTAAIDTLEDIKSLNFPIFNTVVYRKKKYITLYLENYTGSALSTIFDVYDRSITTISEELLNKLS